MLSFHLYTHSTRDQHLSEKGHHGIDKKNIDCFRPHNKHQACNQVLSYKDKNDETGKLTMQPANRRKRALEASTEATEFRVHANVEHDEQEPSRPIAPKSSGLK